MMSPEEIYAIMDGSAQFVEVITGQKTQLVDAGWSEAAAEQVVIEMLRMAPRAGSVSK